MKPTHNCVPSHPATAAKWTSLTMRDSIPSFCSSRRATDDRETAISNVQTSATTCDVCVNGRSNLTGITLSQTEKLRVDKPYRLRTLIMEGKMVKLDFKPN